MKNRTKSKGLNDRYTLEVDSGFAAKQFMRLAKCKRFEIRLNTNLNQIFSFSKVITWLNAIMNYGQDQRSFV